MNTHFSKEGIQRAYEKILNVVIREMPMKTTTKYNFIAIRMAIIKKRKIASVGKERREIGTLMRC